MWFLGMLSLMVTTATATPRWLDRALKHAASQSELLCQQLDSVGTGRFPRSLDGDGRLTTSDAAWWCSGFSAGVFWQLYDVSRSQTLYAHALSLTRQLESQQWNATTHDLGFMLFCSYGQAQRVASMEGFERVLVNGARTLAGRFNKTVGCIQSWDSWNWWQFPVIIDNMMNLELLLWAAEHGGGDSLRAIAVSHADRTMKYHFRSDMSSYHVVSYRKDNGCVEFQGTNQGYSDSSAWARGQTWGLYGYTVMYRFTREPRYLRQAQQIACFLLKHPNMPKDLIPFWDFSCSDYRDSSAAAVMASALLELADYSSKKLAAKYRKVAVRQLRELASPRYAAPAGTHHGFVLMHGVGNYPAHSEIDVPLSYGDYYYVEALCRLRNYYLSR